MHRMPSWSYSVSFAQWQYRSQWGSSEARLLLVENYTQYPAVSSWNMDRHTQFLTSPKGDGNFLFTCVQFLTHWGREEKWQTDTEGGEEGGMHSFFTKKLPYSIRTLFAAREREISTWRSRRTECLFKGQHRQVLCNIFISNSIMGMQSSQHNNT